MKKTNTKILLNCLALLLFVSACNNQDAAGVKSEPSKTEEKTDMSQVKADIQALENQWAEALNKKDVDAIMAMYSDDAMSMQNDGPTLNGKGEIRAQQEKDFAAPATFSSISFQTLEVYGTPDEVTEIGTTTYTGEDGKEKGSGKYMAVFQKKDGQYKCIRDIYNKDAK